MLTILLNSKKLYSVNGISTLIHCLSLFSVSAKESTMWF